MRLHVICRAVVLLLVTSWCVAESLADKITYNYNELMKAVQQIQAQPFCAGCVYVGACSFGVDDCASMNCSRFEVSDMVSYGNSYIEGYEGPAYGAWQQQLEGIRKSISPALFDRAIMARLFFDDIQDPSLLLKAQHAMALAGALKSPLTFKPYNPQFCQISSNEPLNQVTFSIGTQEKTLSDLLNETTAQDIAEKLDWATWLRSLSVSDYNAASSYYQGTSS